MQKYEPVDYLRLVEEADGDPALIEEWCEAEYQDAKDEMRYDAELRGDTPSLFDPMTLR